MTRSYKDDFQINNTNCFGKYKRNDRLCWKLCALKLSCAIENSRIGHLEIIEDLVGNDELIIKI